MRLPNALQWLLLAAIAMSAPVTSGTPSAAAGTDARRGGPMPDSVLAWIGSRRAVSLADFHEAWRQVAPPARPDSLTPQGARRFLDLLAGKEALAELALRDTPAWTAEDSARYEALRDQLTLRAALDSALAVTHARLMASGDSTSDLQILGVAARDSLLAVLEPSWDDSAVAHVAAAFRDLPRPPADSGVMAQIRVLSRLPRLAPADTGVVLVRTTAGPYRAAELMAWWARLDPLTRPRVSEPAQVRELVGNGLFERALRRAAARRALERRPDIAAALARQAEFIAVQHRVAREVYGRLEPDSLALRRWFDDHARSFGLPLRVRIMRLVVGDENGATELALRLRSEADAETLLARATRHGVRYDEDLIAARDSVLFARCMRAGPGVVLGPDKVAAGWQVVRVRALLPARVRSFEEARTLVENDWYGHEGERLMQDLLERSRRAVTVRVNDRALERLTTP